MLGVGIQQRKREAAADSLLCPGNTRSGALPSMTSCPRLPCKDAMDIFWDTTAATYCFAHREELCAQEESTAAFCFAHREELA